MIKMDMDQAAVWLGGSILVMLGFVIVVAGIIVINNIIYKYWKPVKIFTPDSWKGFHPPQQFIHERELERIAPTLEPEQPPKK
jgi:hypothetical protein